MRARYLVGAAALCAACIVVMPGCTTATDGASEGGSVGDCDPNYDGCVPVDVDVDCASGSGNGPSYTDGPVEVVGDDIYGLDADGDGWGCDY